MNVPHAYQNSSQCTHPTSLEHPTHANTARVVYGSIVTLDPATLPIVWRPEFPANVTHSLITATNPKGTISISDLELTGMLAHRDVLPCDRDIAERTVWINADNRAAVSWSTKGSATSVTARAYILRFASFHQRAHCCVVHSQYMPAPPVNVMAGDASSLWNLSDSDLLTHFNSAHPQALSWQMRTLSPGTNAWMIGSLSRKHSRAACLPNATPLPTSEGGNIS